jgi:hypothetical protein
MLLDMLGVIIGFASVMLLLALLVTALTQGTQALLRLRARNLQRGLASILGDAKVTSLVSNYQPESDSASASVESPNALARWVLNTPVISPILRRADPNSIWSIVRGPLVSWVESNTLRESLESLGVGNAEALSERFDRAQDLLSRRFTLIAKCVGLAWAVAVAIVFQVSAPALLSELSTDPELRARYVEAAPGILEYGEGALDRLTAAANVSGNALDQLVAAHPDIRSAVAELPRSSDIPADVSEELSHLLDDRDDREQLIDEFEELVVEQVENQRLVAQAERRQTLDKLSALSITPLRYGGEFYVRANGWPRAGNILGVLATAFLISFGAPFWFNILQYAFTLKDELDPTKRDRTDKDAPRVESAK